MKIIAFIPARCGSKSIPLKNIRELCGKPLIYWNLKALQKAKNVDIIFVATDCEEISEVVKNFNFSKVNIYKRDKENARDDSSTESVMLEFINKHSFDDEDLFILVQATTPFTQPEDFEKAVELCFQKDFDSILSCSRIKKFFWTDQGIPINYDFKNRPRRQDFSGILVENGAFWINRVKNIKRNENRLSGKIGIYEMPEYAAIDIDEEDDWIIAEIYLKKYILTKELKEEPLIEILDKNTDIKFVTICHNETSTGIINPGEKIGKIVREYNKILIVDGVTSVGGDYVYPDKWNFDVLVTGSQKCLGIPPGLGFIMVGSRAWDIINKRTNIHSYYVNLTLYKQWFNERGDTPLTPSIPLIIAQNISLKMMFEEGFENRVKRHRRMAKATRVGAKALGLELFAEEEYASNTVTAIKVPPKINGKEIINSMKELGILIAGGQGELKDKIIRIAHMNVVQEKDILITFSALETALNKLGFDFQSGSGIAAIERIFSQTS